MNELDDIHNVARTHLMLVTCIPRAKAALQTAEPVDACRLKHVRRQLKQRYLETRSHRRQAPSALQTACSPNAMGS